MADVFQRFSNPKHFFFRQYGSVDSKCQLEPKVLDMTESGFLDFSQCSKADLLGRRSLLFPPALDVLSSVSRRRMKTGKGGKDELSKKRGKGGGRGKSGHCYRTFVQLHPSDF